MKADPKISVVIATYNRRSLLARTLPTVVAQDLQPGTFEVIVVSDGCTDGTLEFLRGFHAKCELRVLEQRPNQGQARAANLGARAARGKYVLFLDDDIVCAPDLVRVHLEEKEAKKSDALVFGPVFVAAESPKTLAADCTRKYCQREIERLASSCKPIWPNDAEVNANVSVPRDLFLSHGGFDENFGSARQNEDLGKRLWRAGLPFVYSHRAGTWQVFIKGNHALAVADAAAYGRAEIRLLRKHPYSRQHSQTYRVLRASLPKRFLHRLITTLPLSLELCLRPAFAVAQALRAIPLIRSAGVKILDWRRGVVFHRAAVHEAGGWKALNEEFATVLPVLMYHHIGPRMPGTFKQLTVCPSEFERQMRSLKRRGFSTILTADWLAYIREGKKLPTKPILLTFDDAYADLAQHCFPVLRRFGYSGVVFVPTANIGGINQWDVATGSAPHCILTTEQIIEAANQGIEFGAHTRTHPDLRKLDLAEVQAEMEDSRSELEVLLGKPVISFAYPYGEYGDREVACASRIFPLCFTTDEGKNSLATERGRLRRIMVYGDGLLMFACSLVLAFNPFRRLQHHVRLRTKLSRLWAGLRGTLKPSNAEY